MRLYSKSPPLHSGKIPCCLASISKFQSTENDSICLSALLFLDVGGGAQTTSMDKFLFLAGSSSIDRTNLTVSVRMARTDWRCRERPRPATQQQFQFVKRADGGRILDSDISVRAARRSMPSCLKRLNNPCMYFVSDFHGNPM